MPCLNQFNCSLKKTINKMKKLFFTLAIALVAVFNFSAKAQDQFFYVQNPGGSQWAYISNSTIGITTTQKTTIGGPDNTLTVSPTGGYYTNPYGNFAYGAYWTAPSVFFPLKVSINAGYTAVATNPNTTARRVYIRISFRDASGQFNTYYNSATYTAPANGSVTIPIPACAIDYTTWPVPAGTTVPVMVQLQLIDGQ
jgi:hypothetical protein